MVKLARLASINIKTVEAKRIRELLAEYFNKMAFIMRPHYPTLALH